MEPYVPYQVELVKIADRLATRPGGQGDAVYLRRFRTIYRHLAASVVGLSIESGMLAMGMGMPGVQPGNAGDILRKTEEELSGLAE
jgi:hypothetical protein